VENMGTVSRIGEKGFKALCHLPSGAEKYRAAVIYKSPEKPLPQSFLFSGRKG